MIRLIQLGKIWLFYTTILLISSLKMNGQDSIYHLSNKVDISLLAGGLIANGIGIWQGQKIIKPNTEMLRAWNRDEVPRIDRSATYNWNESLANVSDVLQAGSVLMPLTFLWSERIRDELGTIGLMYLEAIIVNQGLVHSLKSIVRRRRPYVFNENAPFEIKYRDQVYFSFVSGHTAFVAVNGFFAAQVFSDAFPQSPNKKWFWATAVVVPAVTGYLRYESGRHYLTDVVAAYALGATIGVLIPKLHNNRKSWNVKAGPVGDGFGINLQYQW